MSKEIINKIIPASNDEAAHLTKIAFQSKAHWGYPSHWLEIWRDEIELTPEALKKEHVFKAVNSDEKTLGYYRLAGSGDRLELNGLWVLPEYMGNGVGKALFEHMVASGKRNQAKSISWDSDPNTINFYIHMGAKEIDSKTYLLDGNERTLLIFQFDLA